MGTSVKSGYCTVCGKQSRVERKSANHILHLLLTLVTAGIWAIVWLLSSISIGGWRCTVCGGKSVKGVR